jgi:CDP-glycerol glycerophosphotransferase (TagB/SpsB family)
MAAWARAAEVNPRVHLVNDPVADVAPYLMAADALVSDASGVIFQYLTLDRPIVLITNPAAASDEALYDPDAIEWRWRDVGEEVADVKKLAAAVDRALADPDAGTERRAEYRRLLFDDLTDGRAGERIVEKVSAL